MSRFVVVTWAGGGNVAPMLVLAEGLVARGHEVAAVATGSLGGRFDAIGVPTVVTPSGWLPGDLEVTGACDAFEPDALVVDYMLTDALVAAEAAALPTAALVHTLYAALLEDGAPDPIGMAATLDDLNVTRSACGLQAIRRYGDLLDACAAVLVAAPRSLDADPSGDLPPNVAYVGPLVPDPLPAAADGDRPLVVVSLGTAGADPARETEVLGRIVAALGELPVRGLVTLPDYLDRSRLDAPPNVEVTAFVPHSSVLPGAAVVVTHAGLGTVNAALAHGVPLVCLPLDREQPVNAARVAATGAGVALDPTAPVAEIRAAVEGTLAMERPTPVPVDVAAAVDRIEQLAVTPPSNR